MDTRKLAAFVDLAETLSYSRSAERLFLSQSTISKYILALEREWRVQLFVQVHRQVHLTRAGRLILPKVQEVLRRSDDLNQAVAGRFWQRQRPLVIQGLSTLPQYRGFRILTDFARCHPKVKFHFREAEEDQLNHALDQKNVDVVFTRQFGPNRAAYDTLVTDQDQYVVLVPQSHRLAQRAFMTLDQLERQPLLVQREMFSQTNPLLAELRRRRLQPQLIYTGQRTELLLHLVNQGMGLAIVLKQAVTLTAFPRIKVVPLHPVVGGQLVFLKQADNPAAVVDLFWQFATHDLA